MILKQYYLSCLSQASYLIADPTTKRAVIVDPRRDIDPYLEDAGAQGLTIDHVVLTHFHADFISGHLELREKTGAVIHMGAAANPDFKIQPMSDGDGIELGAVRLRVLETPGHTPESICVLVYDLNRDPENPHAVLTGDTLFIGDVGRPDLMASVGITAEELAGKLYDSIREKILTLPDETLVYPAHGAGSMCGKNLSSETVSTIGVQRKMNYALQTMDRGEFVRLVTSDQPTAPEYFAYDASLNRKERATLEENLKKVLVPLSPDRVLSLRERGAQLIDVRDPSDYATRFLTGTVNLGLRGNYASWAGILLDRERPVVILAEPGTEAEAVTRLGRIGFDHVAGYLDGGIMTLARGSEGLQETERLTPQAVHQALLVDSSMVVLDVRTPGEREQSHILGSLHIPLAELRDRIHEVPAHRTVVTQCKSGYRSAIAASLLRNSGLDPVTDMIGGIEAWKAADLHLEGQPVGA